MSAPNTLNSPALVQELVAVAQAAALAPYGKRGEVYSQASQRLGLSQPTLHRHLARISVRAQRKRRSDAGSVQLSVADARVLSTTLMEGYLRAASQISRLATGDRNASASTTTWKVPRTAVPSWSRVAR